MQGNLFEQIGKTMDLLFTKYIKAPVSYEGINRVDVLFAKDKGKIINSECQTLNDVSKGTATRYLTEILEKFQILKRTCDIVVGD